MASLMRKNKNILALFDRFGSGQYFGKDRGHGNTFPGSVPGFNIDQQNAGFRPDRSDFGTWEGKIYIHEAYLIDASGISALKPFQRSGLFLLFSRQVRLGFTPS